MLLCNLKGKRHSQSPHRVVPIGIGLYGLLDGRGQLHRIGRIECLEGELKAAIAVEAIGEQDGRGLGTREVAESGG